jgi:hypothetical protein
MMPIGNEDIYNVDIYQFPSIFRQVLSGIPGPIFQNIGI